MGENMKGEPIPHAHHTVTLSLDEEMRFCHAVIKWDGCMHGSVNDALREAIMQWVEKMEQKPKRPNQK